MNRSDDGIEETCVSHTISIGWQKQYIRARPKVPNNTEEPEYETRRRVGVTNMVKQIGGGASELYKMRENVTTKEKHHNFMRKVAWRKEETSRTAQKYLMCPGNNTPLAVAAI